MPEEYQRDAGIQPLPQSVAGAETLNNGQFSIVINSLTVTGTGSVTVKPGAQLLVLAT
jgi:hypothetical protein